MKKIRKTLELTQEDWWTLARMFFNAAYRDFKRLNELQYHLKDHQVDVFCRYTEKRATVIW